MDVDVDADVDVEADEIERFGGGEMGVWFG